MNDGYITNGITQDGFGARMHRVINTIAFVYYLREKYNINIEYVHTPFAFEGFGENFSAGEANRGSTYINKYGDPYNEINREGYINRARLWDSKLNYNGIKINDLNIDNLEIVDTLDFDKGKLYNDISINEIKNKLYFIKYLHHEFGNGSLDTNIIDKYYSQIKNKFGFIESNINNNAILHIRRKDSIGMAGRYIDDEYYLNILKDIDPVKYNITIHTQRQGFDSKKFSEWSVIYDDEEEDFDLFVKMVSAKILVVGKSSFSIAAGFLNQNTVIYPPQTTIGLSRFITIDKLKNINK
jgi:hypothetical protein